MSYKYFLVNLISMTRKSSKLYMRHTEKLDNYFDLITSHQQYIPSFPPLEIEPTTTRCRDEALPLNYWSTSNAKAAKLTSRGKCVVNQPVVSCSYIRTLTEDTVTSRATSSKRIRATHQRNPNPMDKEIYKHFFFQ